MIGRMGIVTFFCNLTAAIGFGVFALTRSAILNEFGVVAGINIMLLFFISIILIPVGTELSAAAAAPAQMRYLDNRWLKSILKRLEEMDIAPPPARLYHNGPRPGSCRWPGCSGCSRKGLFWTICPKNDPLYTDLKFFEKNFKGVMPLEIVIDTKRKKGAAGRDTVRTLDSMDQLSKYIAARPEMARPLSLEEGLKFIRQAYYGGDSSAYEVPNSTDFAFLSQYLSGGGERTGAGKAAAGPETKSTIAIEE